MTGVVIEAYANDGSKAAAAGKPASSGSFCIVATSQSSNKFVYNSKAGGLQPNSVVDCPATNP